MATNGTHKKETFRICGYAVETTATQNNTDISALFKDFFDTGKEVVLLQLNGGKKGYYGLSWYTQNHERYYYIINGRSKTLYFPDENITYAETVKIAVCLRQLFSSGTVNIENSVPVWYRGFMDAALIWGIVYEDMSDRANEQITRRDFVDILYNAMPENEYQSINDVRYNLIPDIRLDPDVPVTQKIYTFYRAGIIGGADSSGSFFPEDTLSRGEAAAILTRMLDPASRLISRIG